ncbi:MAG: hypothetical protein JXM73_24230 [Anaerolineae bacterium]|nr:hypothetical protein [Anaerolineae bacterium]
MNKYRVVLPGALSLVVVALATMVVPSTPRLCPIARGDSSARPNAGWREVSAGSASGGGISDNESHSASPAIAFDTNGLLYVAWRETSGTGGEIYVRRWTGSAWEEVGAGSASGGGISDNEQDSNSPSIALSPWDVPYVAWSDWSDVDGSEHVYVYRWIDGLWERVGQGAVSADLESGLMSGSRDPQLAIAPNGTVYLAWLYWDDLSTTVYVRRWTGSAWENVGSGPLVSGGMSGPDFPFCPAIAAGPDSKLYAVWANLDLGADTSEIYVRRWNGSAWEEVGAGSDSGGGISDNPDTRSWAPSIAVASDGAPSGVPIVAWKDDDGDEEIYVRRWNDEGWEEMGTGSASDGGISDNAAVSSAPSIAIAPDGTPYVAWHDESNGGKREVYVRRWTGSAWEEVGEGAATGGGVSATGSASSPSIAVAPDGAAYVAWGDSSGGDGEIYVRQWRDTIAFYLPLILAQHPVAAVKRGSDIRQ